MNEPETFAAQVWFLLWASMLAIASGIARSLSEGRELRLLPFLGGILGSGIAAFSFAAFMMETFSVSNLLVLAMAGPIGWIGGDVLAQLGRKWVRQIDRDEGDRKRGKKKRDDEDKGSGDDKMKDEGEEGEE